MPKVRQHKPKLPADFKPLPETFSKAGRHFKLMKREGNVAIYAIQLGSTPDWSVTPQTFEVVLIRQILVGRSIKGFYMPPHEELPSPEQWGSLGFSPPNFERALEIFEELKARRADRTSLTGKKAKTT